MLKAKNPQEPRVLKRRMKIQAEKRRKRKETAGMAQGETKAHTRDVNPYVALNANATVCTSRERAFIAGKARKTCDDESSYEGTPSTTSPLWGRRKPQCRAQADGARKIRPLGYQTPGCRNSLVCRETCSSRQPTGGMRLATVYEHRNILI